MLKLQLKLLSFQVSENSSKPDVIERKLRAGPDRINIEMWFGRAAKNLKIWGPTTITTTTTMTTTTTTTI